MTSFGGLLIPLPTVFEDDGSIDQPLMHDLVDYYIGAGVDGLFIGGSYGQGPAMSPEERQLVAELAIEQTKGRVPVIVHVGAVDPYTSIELGKHALEKGADGVGIVGPYYYSDRSQEELRAHYKMVCDELSAPTLLYNNPKYSGYPIGPEFMAQLRQDSPQIFGAKLAMGTIDEARCYLEFTGDDFQIFSLASSLFPGMLAGIAGSISPPLTICPEIGVELVAAIRRGDYVRALEVQRSVIEFHSAFLSSAVRKECGRGIYHAGLIELGFPVKKYPRWPVGEVSEKRQLWMRALIKNAKAVLTNKAA